MDLGAIFASADGSAGDATDIGIPALITRMVVAVLIGAGLSLRPWRLLMGKPMPRSEMIQAQILLCAAAAVITCVIGNSLAKAFGLVGLGGFVRFRSGLKDPRDAAILFLLIGLGMACGHGSLHLAGIGTAFVALLLVAIDLFGKTGEAQRVRLSASADDLAQAEPALRHALGARNVMVKACAVDFAGRRMELDLEEPVPGSISAALKDSNLATLRELRWSTVQQNGKAQREELV